MQFEVNNTTELLINELQKSMEETIGSLRDGQNAIRSVLEGVDGAASDELKRLADLQARIDTLIASLDTKCAELSGKAERAYLTARYNGETLAAISAYLSLPGYKRFFKGMEEVKHEGTE